MWSSDEPTPSAPAGLNIDLWLVLCADDGATAPAWRETFEGIWCLFPGSTRDWSPRTSTTVESWKPDRLLVDRLPDEVGARDWLDRWAGWRPLWLPTWGEASRSAGRRVPLVVAVDTEFPEWIVDPVLFSLAEAHGGEVAKLDRSGERVQQISALAGRADCLLLCSKDPALRDVAADITAAQGALVLVWGSTPVWWCERLLGGTIQRSWNLDFPAERLLKIVREISARIAADRRTKPREGRAPGWKDWLAAVTVNPGEWTHGRVAAAVMPALYELYTHPDTPVLTEEWRRLMPEWRFDSLVAIALPTADFEVPTRHLLRQLAHLPTTPETARFFVRLTRIVPLWPRRLVELTEPEWAGETADCLFTRLADEHVFDWRRQYVELAAGCFRTALQFRPADPELLVKCATTAALLGDFVEADVWISKLGTFDPRRQRGVLLAVMRAWSAGLDGGILGIVPLGGAAWWQAAADESERRGGFECWPDAAFGAARFGNLKGADERLQRGSAAPVHVASAAIIAWLMADTVRAQRLWGTIEHAIWPDSIWERFTLLCASVLCGPFSTGALAELATIDASPPDIFESSTPSHSRCALRAMIHRRLGDELAAQAWWRRALDEDPMAVLRAPAFERARPLSDVHGL